MADIRDSVVSFLQRTRLKFDYYAGGRFLRQTKPQREHKEEPLPPKKKRKLFQSSLRPKPLLVPIPSPSLNSPKRRNKDVDTEYSNNRVHQKSSLRPKPLLVPISSPSLNSPKRRNKDVDTEYSNNRVLQILESGDTNPLNLFERRIRSFKPPPQVIKPPPQVIQPPPQVPKPPSKETSIAQPSKGNNTPSELTMRYNLRSSNYRQRQLHRPLPAPIIIYNTITLYDDFYEKEEEYKIFKDTERFWGNLAKFSEYAEDSRDSDVQTTHRERQAGEELSENVLSETIDKLLSMKVEERAISCRLTKLLARFNNEE